MLYEDLRDTRVHIPEGVKKIYEAVIKDGRSLVINDSNLNNDLIPNGSLLIDGGSSKMKIKKDGEFSAILPLDIFERESLTDTVIARNSVNGNRIRQRSISRDRIEQESLTAEEIENATITGAKIAEKAINSQHIKSGAIDSIHLQTGSVDGTKIQLGVVSGQHLETNCIGNEHLKVNAVEERHLEADCVTSEKLREQAVQSKHLSDNSVLSQHLAEAQVLALHLANQAVETEKIALAAVGEAQLGDGSVTNTKLAKGCISADNLRQKIIGYQALEQDLYNRLMGTLEVIGNVGTLPILNATERIMTKHLSASGDAILERLQVSTNAVVNGTLHAKGDISTDGRIFRATFNDLAEGYVPGEPLTPGDIVEYRKNGKIYKSSFSNSEATVVGVVSDCYADCYGASLDEIATGAKVPVGLIGKVPVKIIGPVKLGQYIVAGDQGVGFAVTHRDATTPVIGKALACKTSEKIEPVLCLIFPN